MASKGHQHIHIPRDSKLAGTYRNSAGEIDIIWASQVGDLRLVKELIDKEGRKATEKRDDKGRTCVHWAALGGFYEVVEYFIQIGTPFNLPTAENHKPKPIHWACVNGHVSIVDLLIEHGVSINESDAKDCTPLIYAAQYGKAMLAGYLIGKGANLGAVDVEGDNALHWACFKGHTELVSLFLNSGFDPHKKDSHLQQPLHLASLSGDLASVESLVERNVELDVPDKNGKTPILLATGRGHKAIIRFLDAKVKFTMRCSFRDVVFGPPGRSRAYILFYFFQLFILGYPVYFYSVYPETYEMMPSVHLYFWLTNLLMWVSLYFANRRDPGFLPSDKAAYGDAIRQVRFFDEWSKKTGQNPLEKLCHTCKLVRPLRAKHCRICNRCIRDFDHHCPYINNCVGFNTRSPFFFFTFSVASGCLFTIYFSWKMIGLYGWHWLFTFGLFEFSFFGLLVASLVLFQFCQISSNLTTNERMNVKRYQYLKGPAGEFQNPFDRGALRNVLEYFHCIKPILRKDLVSYYV